jgi:long-chain acyl-CoA synthetase
VSGRNVFTLLEETARVCGNAGALHQPSGSKAGGGHRTYSWNEWLEASREIALGLRRLGLKNGEIAGILSETRAEFYIVDLGIMGAGGVAGALYTAYPVSELARNITSIQPRFLFIEDAKLWQELADAIRTSGGAFPSEVIVMTGSPVEGTRGLADVQALGQQALAENPEEFKQIQETISPSDPAILYLTSGATGEPKMSLTSHAAVLANADMAPIVLPITPQDSTLVFLPSAHIAQRIVLEIVPMRMGTPVWFSESLNKLPNELRTIRPTMFLAPPRVWERMYATIQNEGKRYGKTKQKIFRAALKLGIAATRLREAGKRVPLHMAAALKMADRLVYRKIRERLGGRIRIAASGAAPLGRELAEFYSGIGMPLFEGYGLTEAGVLCLNPLGHARPGSIGKALPGVELRTADDGELQVRTPCLFEGYYKDPAATRSVMTEDGWFSTGDIAESDADGYWYITGRKKELIVSSNGKKIYPSRVENLFKVEPVINQILLIGDKKPYVTALLTVNTAQAQSLDVPVEKAVQEAVGRVNQQLADFERIRRFRILQHDFSIERGELTPTMKIRRSRVLENYAPLLAELYLGKEEMH